MPRYRSEENRQRRIATDAAVAEQQEEERRELERKLNADPSFVAELYERNAPPRIESQFDKDRNGRENGVR